MPGVHRLPQFRPYRPWIPTAAPANVTVSVAAGSVVWSGQTASANLTVPVTAGSVVWAGQTVTTKLTAPVVAGAATWNGQAVTVLRTVPVTAGSVVFSGQAVNVTQMLAVTAGAVAWQGQTIALILPGAGTPVKGPTRKTSLVGDDNLVDVLSAGMGADLGTTFGDITVGESTFGEAQLSFGGFSTLATDITEIDIIGGDDNDAEELAGAPRAVLIGAGANSLVEV